MHDIITGGPQNCASCTVRLGSCAYAATGFPGVYCSVSCLETGTAGGVRPRVRRFELLHREGEKVAEGCLFSDGRVAVRWQRRGLPGSSVWWDSLEDARTIHTGVGGWHLRFID